MKKIINKIKHFLFGESLKEVIEEKNLTAGELVQKYCHLNFRESLRVDIHKKENQIVVSVVFPNGESYLGYGRTVKEAKKDAYQKIVEIKGL